MVHNVYTLLVGIDNYPSPLPALRGCVNDIDAFEQYLNGWIQNNPDYTLQPSHRLTDKQASRQAVIDGFRTYLSQAESEDVALFYYSGHGSQAPSPPEFWTIESDRLNETLVCWDSRLNGQWDLADKELARLIAEIAQNTPHIIVILDCCHSGTGTRHPIQSVATRQVPADVRQRPFETFLRPLTNLPDVTVSRSSHPQSLPQWHFPQGRHVLLAACREHEEAREFFGGGQYRGAFSYFLMETLKQASGSLTYRDLFRRTNARVRSQIASQTPQLEATYPPDLDQPFLGGAITRSLPYYVVSYDTTQGWVIDGGAIHGIPAPSTGEYSQLAIFPFDTASNRFQDAQQAIAQAKIVAVFPRMSQLRIVQGDECFVETQTIFKAVLTAVPLPSTTVSLEGDEPGVQLVRQALKTSAPNGQPSLYLREAEEFVPAQLKLMAQDGSYLIARLADTAPLMSPSQGYTLDSAVIAVRQLEHIARWMTVSDLASPAVSQIPADALQIHIYQGEQQSSPCQSQIYLTYEWDTDRKQWRQPTFRIKLANQSDLTLFCALYDLTETFAINSLLEGGTVRLEPGEEVWVAQGQTIYGSVPKILWQQGITEFFDILKVIACTADFDATLLEQDEVGHPLKRAFVHRPLRQSTLNHLMQRVMIRDLEMLPEAEETFYDDWVTNQVTFTVIRPQPIASISAKRAINLGYGVTLNPHPSLQGSVYLTTFSQATRDLNHPTLPPLLRTEPQVAQPLTLTNTGGMDSGLNVLELKDVTHSATVTSECPLKLVVPVSIQSNEYILPIAFDGEFFIPLGKGHAWGNQTEILLERLPNPSSTGSRSLGGSIRIFFQKVVAQKLGLEFPYPILAAVDKIEEKTPRYDADPTSVTQRVSKAQKILLYIHGIFGNTRSMIPSACNAQIEVNNQLQCPLDLYDLVLTFDYENLNTPVGDLAKQLGNRLTAVGLGPNHRKTLHVVAHSLGGLIARCFIEQQAGRQVVQHLIMMGTPNAGSPWPTLQDWATTALVIGLNSLSSVALPAKALGSLMAAIELVDVTLDQMKPGSDFLKSLADSVDPGVPYTVLAGNISLIALPDDVRNRVIKMLDRIGRATVEFPFMNQPNDLLATVYSIQAISLNRSPPPQLLEVACNHLSYFTNAAGLQALSQALIGASRLDDNSNFTKISPQNHNHLDNGIEHPSRFWLVGLLVLLTFGAIFGVWLFQTQSEDSDSYTPTFPAKVYSCICFILSSEI